MNRLLDAANPKATHKEAQYGPGRKAERCSICEHYRGLNDCTKVVAPVSPMAWCKFFEERGK
jgi:hypothetical protein